MRRLAVGLLLFVGMLAPSQAHAIIGGELDGNRHPNVGLIVTYEVGGGGVSCTGTLIAPTVVVTAAHCVKQTVGFPPIEEIRVTFDSSLEPDPTSAFGFAFDRYMTATPYGHPAYYNGPLKGGMNAYFANFAYDIGVLILPAPASTLWPGITPAPLPPAGFLDPYATGTRNRLFTQVGYGTFKDIVPPKGHTLLYDATRRMTTSPLWKLTPTLLNLNGNQNDARGGGGTCHGDSGGPVFLDKVIVAVHSFGQGSTRDLCDAKGPQKATSV